MNLSEYMQIQEIERLRKEKEDLDARITHLQEITNLQSGQVDRLLSIVRPYSDLVKVLEADLVEARQQNKELVLMLNRAMNLIGGKYATT
jgi:hypothetical protein